MKLNGESKVAACGFQNVLESRANMYAGCFDLPQFKEEKSAIEMILIGD